MKRDNENLTQKKFDKISIGLSSPEVILNHSRGEVLNLKQLIIVHTSLKGTAYSVKEYLDQ